MKKTISIILAILMLSSAVAVFPSFADDNGRTLDFRAEKDVFEQTELYPNGITRGGLRDDSFDIADEIGFEALTGVEFPEGGASIDAETAVKLYNAAVKTAEKYSNVIFSEAWAFENVPISDVFDDEMKLKLDNEIDAFSKDEIEDLDRQIMLNRIAVAGIFWEFVTEYLPEGAADKIVIPSERRSCLKAVAIADIEKAGTDSIDAVYSKYGKGALDIYDFNNIVVYIDGRVVFYSADDNESIDIRDAENYRLSCILDNEYSKRLNERAIPIYNINEDIVLNARQVIEVMKFLIGVNSEVGAEFADFNSDGNVNAKDVTAMMKAIVAQK